MPLGICFTQCCDETCAIFNLAAIEETEAYYIQSDIDDNEGTETDGTTTLACCDGWHDTPGSIDPNYDPADFWSDFGYPFTLACVPEGLDHENVTCGLWYQENYTSATEGEPCGGSGGFKVTDEREVGIIFVKNPTDGNIWIIVRCVMTVDYSSPTRTASSTVWGYLDTGLQVITETDGPFDVPLIDPDTCGEWLTASCFDVTPGTLTVTLVVA
jgi:hypothetical protein